MNTALFASPFQLIGGLAIGLIFGFLLQKANVTRFSKIVGQLLLKDFTVMKVILTAIAFGSFLLYSIKYFFPSVGLLIDPTTLATALIGGGVFGIGMATLGYCPGTCVGAAGEKSKDALFGIVGMILGAGFYAEISRWIHPVWKTHDQMNQATLAQHFDVSHWLFIGALCIAVISWVAIEKYIGQKKTTLQKD